MKIQKFTDKGIKALKPDYKRYEVSEVNGLGLNLRVSPSGIKSWVYIFSFSNGIKRRTRVLTLGIYPDLSLTEAREAHSIARSLRRKGIDPATE